MKSAFKYLILKYYKCLWYCSKHNIWNLSNLLLSRKTWENVDKYYSDKFNFPSRALIVVQRCYVCNYKGWVTLKATVKAEYEATNNHCKLFPVKIIPINAQSNARGLHALSTFATICSRRSTVGREVWGDRDKNVAAMSTWIKVIA